MYLYADPYPQDAAKLRFSLNRVVAVKDSGAEYPLTVVNPGFQSETANRQRLLATAELPPGTYSGFYFTAERAYVTSETGEHEVETAAKSEVRPFPFEIKRGKAEVFTLTFRTRESLPAAAPFTPVFAASLPSAPLTDLVGYTTNYGSNNITIFDKMSGEVHKVVATGSGPCNVVFDKARLRAFVVLSGEDRVDVIDLRSHEVVNHLKLNAGDRPCEAALTPDGKTLIVANSGTNSVSFVDPLSNFESYRLAVGNGPRSIILDPAGTRAYVFNGLSSTISVIDVTARTLLATVATESVPVRGDFNRKGDRLFVFHQWSPNVLVFDVASLSVVKRLYLGIGVSSLKVDRATDRLFVSMKGNNRVDIYDPFSYLPMDFITVAGTVSYMSIDVDQNDLLLVLSDRNAVQSVNLVSKMSRYISDTGVDPSWSAIMGER
ncbi:beta-propeller fold lactonase family protein [Geomonas sp. Red69]|uniref:YncE family protein n=1 Tax=Geomonas diazotrophica TaxID=2843197 RepID=UPI001C0FF9DE|nr:beta-propeller fold lactonase family protein [Geomonas diazotrophica]MBU5637918.1 beta-propeller fold lactonase family protein [Geomonas diazotrophica]